MLCRVCQKEMVLSETLKGKEQNVTTLYKAPFIGEKRDIELYRCPYCSHMQIEWENPAGYYDDYSLIAEPNEESEKGRYSPLVLDYYQDKFKQLSSYAHSHERILDIGCGAGILMEYEEQYFKEALGIEPSKVQYNIAHKLGKKVINAYFTRELELLGGYSAFVSTQVFEHITVIREVLEYAYELLEAGGVGLVEVPNGQKMYCEQSYYDVFSDHVNYYTPLSLCMLAYEVGFEVIQVSEEFNRNHMSLFVRKPFHQQRSFETVIQEDSDTINTLLKRYSKISVWGVGAKARSFIQLIDRKDKLLHYWDINSMIWGQYLDSAKYPITKPNGEEIQESDVILIFAAAYTEEIINDLKKKYGYSGDVICFDKGIVLQHI